MNLIKCYQTNSTWYKGAKRNGKPVGILWHDTGAGNPYIKRYVQPLETDADYKEKIALFGKNQYSNDWNHIDRKAGLNAWIGKLADGSVATVQAGDWDIHAWGCGGGDRTFKCDSVSAGIAAKFKVNSSVTVTGEVYNSSNTACFKKGATLLVPTNVNANQEFETIKSISKLSSGKSLSGTHSISGTIKKMTVLSDGSYAITLSGGIIGCCNGYARSKTNTKPWVEPFWIQFEICDDGYGNEAYFKQAYKEACEFTAYICKMFNIDPNGTVDFNGAKIPTILCHADSYTLGMGGNHGDIYTWFKKYGYDMTNVRADVAKLLPTTEEVKNEPTLTKFELLDVVRIKEGVTKYSNGTLMKSWVTQTNLYIREVRTSTCVVSTLKEGAITGVCNTADLVLVERATPTEEKKPEVIVETKVTVTGTPSTGSKADEKVIWDFLLSKIGNEYGVAGVMGNMYAESGLRSDNMQNSYESKLGLTDKTYTSGVDNGSYTNFVNDSVGYGLVQWTYYSLKQDLLNYVQKHAKSIGDLQVQLDFFAEEIKAYKSVWPVLCSATSVREASDAMLLGFERPASKDSEETQSKRASYGQKYYDAYHTVVPVVEEPVKEEVPKEPATEDKTEPVVEKPVEESVTSEPKEDSESKVEDTENTKQEESTEQKEDVSDEALEKETVSILTKILNIITYILNKIFKKK